MIGKPKYQVGDKVTFKIFEDNKRSLKLNIKTYNGTIYIVDQYGTFENDSDVSYDIMVSDFGPKHEECLFKHITESLVYPQ